MGMETSLVDLQIDDEEDKEENDGWMVAQEIHETEVVPDLTLVGCFLTPKEFNFHSMKSTLANLWHPLGGVTITHIGEKRLTFRFYYAIDIERVINGTPWTFDNQLLII